MPVLELIKDKPPLVERQTPIPEDTSPFLSPVPIRITESATPGI